MPTNSRRFLHNDLNEHFSARIESSGKVVILAVNEITLKWTKTTPYSDLSLSLSIFYSQRTRRMADSPYILEVTAENFISEVMERSKTTPVLVDFWAEWCGPCKSLMPLLDKIVEDFNGGLILAKVDTDAEQQLASQAGIRSLPTVMLFVDGQPVDQFMGALPEGEILAFLAQHGVSSEPQQETEFEGSPLEIAMALHANGQTEQAKAILQQAQADSPEDADIMLGLGQISLALGDLETVDAVLKHLPDEAKEGTEAKKLNGLINFARADNLDFKLEDLQNKLESGEISSEERYQLGVKYAVRSDFDESVEAFLGLMMRDREFGEDGAKQSLIALFDILGEDPRSTAYRRRMFSLLH